MNTGKIKIGNLSVFLFWVLIVGCTPSTPTPQAQVAVTKITESDLVTGEITQVKTFNQCDSANPIKLEIQFGDNVSASSQQELILGGSIMNGADISTIDKLEIEGSLEQHFASSQSSGMNHQESVGIEIPAFTRQEYTIIWKETRREGTVEYTKNGKTKVTDFSYRIGLEFFASSVKDIDCSLPTETPLPAEPTASPASEVPTTLPIGTLADGCINPRSWTPVSNEVGAVSPISDGCYSIENVGIFADPQGILHLYKQDQKSAESAGIYTPINNKFSVIEFNIDVNSMYIADTLSPALITFAVAPAIDPMSANGSARFRLFVEQAGNNPIILFMMADVGENNGVKIATQHYEYSRTYRIRLELLGDLMRVYINDLRIDESLSIPDGPKVFYIGYTLPALAGMDVEISNILIDSASPNQSLHLQEAFEEVDLQFNNVIKSSIAFNRPNQMEKDETVSIELIINPSLSESTLVAQLAEQSGLVTSTAAPSLFVTPTGEYFTSSGESVKIESSQIEITPRMKAVLNSQDPDAFVINEMHDDAEQVVGSANTTKWRWSVTAKKEGSKTLELVIYQLIKYDNQEFWHEVETYKANILVNVTMSRWLRSLDWKWVASAIIIPFVVAVWGWLRNTKKKDEEEKNIQVSKKKKKKKP